LFIFTRPGLQKHPVLAHGKILDMLTENIFKLLSIYL